MDNTEINKGYTLALLNRKSGRVVEKRFLKPMALYVPTVAFGAVTALVDSFDEAEESTVCEAGYALTITNNNNGVSVDKDVKTLTDLSEQDAAADAVKELINIVRGYDDEDEHNVCGW